MYKKPLAVIGSGSTPYQISRLIEKRKVGGQKIPIHIRFWKKVKKTDGCWLWMGSKPGGKYGGISHNGKQQMAHRVSWELHNGKIPDGMACCHHCDNPPCVRVDHLFLGTRKDNQQDSVKKGRHSCFKNVLICNKKRRNQKTCKRGHVYKKTGFWVNAKGGRICRACSNRHQKRNYWLSRGIDVGI